MSGAFGSHKWPVIILLCPRNAFNRHQIRIGSCPATWYGCAMKIDHQMVFRGILHQVYKIVDDVLLITFKKIYLDAIKPGFF